MENTFRRRHIRKCSLCRLLVGIAVFFCATASCTKPNPQHTPSPTQHTPSPTQDTPSPTQHTVGDSKARIEALLADTSDTITDDLIKDLVASLGLGPTEKARIGKLLKDIEEGSISVDYRDGDCWGCGCTALHYAAIACTKNPQSPTAEWDRLVNILLNKRADPNIRNQHGHTPLEIAIEYQCVSIVGVLVAKGADLKQKNQYGLTPVEYAGYFYENYRNSGMNEKEEADYEILQILQEKSQATNR